MKKITLLLTTLLLIISNVNAQDFQNENFEGLTVGNVGTDADASSIGQGGFITFTSSGQNSDFQIINEGGDQGKVLQITGSANDTEGKLIWKNGLDASWASRTSGNDILEFEFDFFTGSTTATKNISAIQIYDSSYDISIAGFLFTPETKGLYGLIYADDGNTVDNFPINLGALGSEIILLADTWYKVGFAFNKTTGEVIFKGPGFYFIIQGAAAGIDPYDYDFLVVPDTGNSSSFNFKFDNLRISAVDSENLLGLNDLLTSLSKTIKIYPNPAKDVINLSASNNFNLSKLEIIDINGRLIKSISIENMTRNEINISELQKGLYLINIYSNDGMITKKILKE